MFLEENVAKILDTAEEKGLENVEIRIGRKDEDESVTLWVGDQDRFSCNSLSQLQSALNDHEDLKWMN